MEISLWTRRNIQASYKFPEIIKALKDNIDGDDWILDGEMTVAGGFRQLLNRNVEDRFKNQPIIDGRILLHTIFLILFTMKKIY